MKSFFLILAFIGLLNHSVSAQILNHPTIEKVQVSYKAVPSAASPGSAPINGPHDINVLPNVTIIFKNPLQASKVFLKIMNKQTNAVVYQINYLINSAVVNSPNGVILFKKENNIVKIGVPDVLPLKPYVYELYTEDAQGKASMLFSITQ